MKTIFHQPTPHGDDGGHAHDKHDIEWTYAGTTGPQHWAEMYKTCGGQRQSPVDIDVNEAIKAEMDPLVFRHYLEKPASMDIHNNGHTAQLGARMARMPQVTGGALQDDYEFLQLHFHWGAESDKGSEHTVNGKSTPLEMHIVHFNTKYPSVNDVIEHKYADGLAVVGVMFEVSEEDNPAWDTLLEALDRIPEPTNSTMIKDVFSLGSLLPHDTSKFFSYEGSLTTPGCHEIVMWTVLADRVPISEQQLEHFRDLKSHHDHTLVNNFRPIQPYNGRRIMVRHIEEVTEGSSEVTAGASTILATFCWSVLMFLIAIIF